MLTELLKTTPPSGLAAGGGALALAGVVDVATLEALPKGAIVAIAMAALSVAFFLAKRDYSRIDATLQRLDARLDALEAKAGSLLSVESAAFSFNRLHEKINNVAGAAAARPDVDDLRERVARAEYRLSLCEGDADKTPPIGTRL